MTPVTVPAKSNWTGMALAGAALAMSATATIRFHGFFMLFFFYEGLRRTLAADFSGTA